MDDNEKALIDAGVDPAKAKEVAADMEALLCKECGHANVRHVEDDQGYSHCTWTPPDGSEGGCDCGWNIGR